MTNMEERPIVFHLLNKDELIYEITVRGGKPEGTVDKLRTQAKALNSQMPTDEISDYEGDSLAELRLIKSKLEDLDNLCGQRPMLLKSLNRIQALGNHLFHRLSRVVPEEEPDRLLKGELDEHLSNILNRLDRALQNFKSSVEFKFAEDAVSEEAVVKEEAPSVQVFSCDRGSQVHTLNLKFNGKGSVHEFLERLEELCLSRNISDEKLFKSAAELFSDDALCWYRSVRNEAKNWSELKAWLMKDFVPQDFDLRQLQEIRTRTQGPDESIVKYLSVMHNLFARLSFKLSEVEKLDIVKCNVRPSYTTQLAFAKCDTWANFKQSCRELEAVHQRAALFVEPRANPTNAVSPDLAYRGKVYRKSEAVSARTDKFCVRCREDGHMLLECKAPPSMVCFKCGEKGVTARTCPRCVVHAPSPAKN